ncbi:MAG TPA: hypothetical protein VKU77_26605 [Streptosporangiaceae bacterium]|nr:hypothetical protein [Streptosporangiaceae bacterium]
MTARNPTPQGISALLRRAGFTRSVERTRDGCSGFVVTRHPASEHAVHVRHSFFLMNADRDGNRRKAKLAAYAKTITEAGWTVEAGEHELIVTAAPEQEEN